MTSVELRSLIEAVRSMADGADPQRDAHIMDFANALDVVIRSGALERANEMSIALNMIATQARIVSDLKARVRAGEVTIQVQSDRITTLETMIHAVLEQIQMMVQVLVTKLEELTAGQGEHDSGSP